MFNKKAISPVVATSLLLVVAVVSVVGFQSWYNTFSSNLFVSAEQDSGNLDTSGIEGIIGDTLYLKAGNNLTVESVQIDGNDCNINGTYSGTQGLDVSDCLSQTNSATPEIVMVTDDKVLSKSVYISVNSETNLESNSYSFVTPCDSNPTFYSGDGSTGDPYQICSCTQLQNISTNLNANYILIGDIDCSETTTWNSGNGFNPLGCGFSNCGTRPSSNGFTGNFNGNNYTILDLYINRGSENTVGIFGGVYGIIQNTRSIVNINGGDNVGGLIGYLGYSSIDNSYSTGSVDGTTNVGGLVGQVYGGSVDNSYSTSSVNGSNQVGGLVGAFGGDINNSYSTGNVTGTTNVGGLVGDLSFGTVSSSYWDNQTSGQNTSSGGTGLTTTQMYQQASYVGWDFTNIWDINESTSYPFLR